MIYEVVVYNLNDENIELVVVFACSNYEKAASVAQNYSCLNNCIAYIKEIENARGYSSTPIEDF